MAIAARVRRLMQQGSWIRRMFEEGIALKQQYGDDNVFDLSLGNPIMEPPPKFFEVLRRIAEHPEPGMHRYMPNAGYVETRDAVAAQLTLETRLPLTADHIVLSCGGGATLNVVLKALLDPGDEVVIFAPYFVEYLAYCDNHGGACRIVPTVETNFLPDLDAFESSIGPRTRIVLVNSPNNPTGVVYGAGVLARLGEIIRDKEAKYETEISLVSDEPYRKILFDGAEYPHVFQHHPRSIVATSHSKDLALPGERIGIIAVSPDYEGGDEVVDALTYCNRTLGFVNAPALMQHIVKHLQDVTINVGDYQAKRDYLYARLTEIGYSTVKPAGAFYMFPRSPIEDDVAFVGELRKRRVLVVPGSGFGAPGHFRIAYCVSDSTIEGSVEGFRRAFEAATR